MLLVKTKTGPSLIEGTGLFADELIPKGARIWEFSKETDEAYTKEDAETLPEPKRSDILGLHFSYVSKKTGRYILSGDDAKYMNHSFTPNTRNIFVADSEEDIQLAVRDIQKGEELTVDYRVFEDEINFEIKN